jgi:hypothetical protein
MSTQGLSINGKLDIAISSGYATKTPSFPLALPLPLIELLLRVVIIEVTTLRAIIP